MLSVFGGVRKALRCLVAAGAVAGLAACEPVGLASGAGPAVDAGAPVPVALIVPGNSPQAGDAALARSLENAARLAIADLQGVEVDLRVYNTGAQAGEAAAAAVRAVDEGAQVILGPVFADAANAAGVAVAGRGINVLSFSNNPDIAGGNVFVLGNTFRNTADRLVRYAAQQGRGNILVVHERTPGGEVGRRAIEQAIAGSPARLAGVEGYAFSQEDVAAAVPRIASAVRTSGATAIFLTADSAGALQPLAQLLPEAGVSPTTTKYIGLTRWDIPPATLQLPGLQGGWFALPDPGLSQQFAARYAAVYGQPPGNPIAGLAYDGIAAVGALVRSGRRDALSASALTQGSGFAGVNGIFRFRPDGTAERALAVAEVRNNQVSVIDPAPRSFAGAGF